MLTERPIRVTQAEKQKIIFTKFTPTKHCSVRLILKAKLHPANIKGGLVDLFGLVVNQNWKLGVPLLRDDVFSRNKSRKLHLSSLKPGISSSGP